MEVGGLFVCCLLMVMWCGDVDYYPGRWVSSSYSETSLLMMIIESPTLHFNKLIDRQIDSQKIHFGKVGTTLQRYKAIYLPTAKPHSPIPNLPYHLPNPSNGQIHPTQTPKPLCSPAFVTPRLTPIYPHTYLLPPHLLPFSHSIS